MKATDCQRQAQLFAALAHPVRLRVLEVLAENEACVCHLCTLLGEGGPEAGRSSAVPDCPCPRCRAKRPNGGPARMAGAAPANKDSGGTGPQ